MRSPRRPRWRKNRIDTRSRLDALWVLALLLSAVLAGGGLHWALDHYVPLALAPEIPPGARIQHPGSGRAVARARDRLARLPPARREEVLASLRRGLLPLGKWLTRTAAARHGVICLGERHGESTRGFLADRVLPHLPVDTFLLEATNRDTVRLRSRAAAGRAARLLDAPIDPVLRAATRANPHVAIAGIDETVRQRRRRERGHAGTRDRSIAENFRARFRPGRRHLILFGALHCRARSGWLYERIRGGPPGPSTETTLNVHVVDRHEHRGIEAFVNFVEDVGLARPEYVIRDTGALDPLIYSWFPELVFDFVPYRSVVVYDARRLRRERSVRAPTEAATHRSPPALSG